MPTLFTALLARNTNRKTLAPKNQRPPVRVDIAKLPKEHFDEHVAESYSGVLAEMVRVEEPVRSIGVVGAGLAGLSAAYELRRRGYKVRVFEASDRVGGRTWSNHKLVTHHVMERGAELIGANHPLWLTYADTFHLEFSDVKEYENSSIYLGKHLLLPKDADILFEHMKKAFDFISSQSKTIIDPFQPWTDSAAPTLDQKNVHAFVMRIAWTKRCKFAILQQLESDNGVPAQDQSLLGLLSMVKGGGMERYWEDTEVYRCRRGAQALSQAFEDALRGMNVSVEFKTPVNSVDASGKTVKLEISKNGESPQFTDVILAIPPSAWPTIRTWSPTPLSDFMGAPPPQMGKNTKALFAFRNRFWKRQGEVPSSTQNGPVDQTWETTEDYKKPQFGMVAFSGANNAAQLSQLTDAAALNRVATQLDLTYTNLSKRSVDKEFVNWPTRDWALASYSFPKCGDIMNWGPKLSDGYEGKVHFAGEHTCYAFTGYMEGALQSGYRLARKLVHRDGQKWSQPPIQLRPVGKPRK
jgi:monoamine oxidase